MERSLSPDQRADLLVAAMTLDEKVSLLHGGGWGVVFAAPDAPPTRSLGGAGFIPGVARLGIPDLQMADAAVGVTRSSTFGRYSTPLPSGVSEASSWDLNVAREYGALIGRELRDQGYSMSLGGGVNLTREPRNGRNFEYKGEDPILAGRLVGAEMKALQEQGIIGHTKHYALNDQENGRSFVNVKAEERAMRQTDLLAFEIGIKESGLGAVMCSYNLLNGDYACENSYLLNELLKKQWGFPGFVISDWGATHSTVKAALSGLDMEMPGDTFFGAELKKAVESGTVPVSRLNDMVHRILRSEFAAGLFDNPPSRKVPNIFTGLEVAQRVAEQGSVLLKNAEGQLPLSASRIRSIAVIGSHADAGVLSGGGSAQVDPPGGNAVPPRTAPRPPWYEQVIWHPSSPLKAIRAKAPNATVEYNPGTDPAAAAALAAASAVAIVFVNQPTSEGADAANLSLPNDQDALVSAVAAANPHTVVVLETGGAVTMPWIDRVTAVLAAWYPGIRGGEAIANILFGDVNPSAKLPLTFPRSEADLPHPTLAQQPPPASDADMVARFPGDSFKVNTRKFDLEFSEGLKVGYKWYDAEGKDPLFPFGFGLSYTTWAYSDLKVTPGPAPTLAFTLKNAGTRPGAEVAQVYVTLPAAAGEPFKRLVSWDKVPLAPGEAKTVTLTLDPHYLSIFDPDKDAWSLLPGDYSVHVGGSSRDLPLRGAFRIGGGR
ncbi:MAG: glycoside hydrolase family 3 C-terminal domain-containing protein [Bryobacteraceae bacterium]|jgi:beta-glucosidase